MNARRWLLSLLCCVAAVAPAAADPGWPRAYTTSSGGRLQIYQPQIASWEGSTHLVAYVAVAYYAKDADTPALGTVKVEADTEVALAERMVRFATFTITETSFGSLGRAQTREIVAEIDKAIPSVERVMALDRVLAGLDRSQILPKNIDGVKADPPAIFFSTTPAVLVNFDGEPVWSPIAGTDLRYAVNTNWDVFEHTPSKTFFLRNQYVWLKAHAVSGPWMPAGSLPASFTKLPWDANWTEVKASLPGRRITASETPTVFVSTTPAELILLRGVPRYQAVSPAGANGSLMWVDNTDSDLFRLGTTGRIYYLVAGRWFAAPDFSGPWTFATPTLPAAFRQIPIEHPRSRVLASVPGTIQAAEAVVLAQIPQTARVSKQSLPPPDVQYLGEPRYASIEQTSLQRITNTDKDIIKVGDLYYLCFQGVWFVSASARGPWVVTGRVPQVIYTIPASSPVHHVTYVTIVEDSADLVVVAARAGYTGTMIAWGCAVWGTGWYYPPYVWYGAAAPIYYPYAATYGAAAWFDPRAGTYARGAVAYGPYGARGVGQAYNPRTNTYAQTRQGAGVYGSWGSTYVQRGDDWARTARATNHVTGTTARVTRTDDGAMIGRVGPGGGRFVAAGEEGVYAGRDGNVYRRADGGGWQKYENGAWGATATPPDARAAGQLEHDRAARAEGSQRVRERASAPANGGRRAAGGDGPRRARRR